MTSKFHMNPAIQKPKKKCHKTFTHNLHAIYTHTWATHDKGKTKSSNYATVAHEHNLRINSKYS
jgi:hypothetical protein